ncbi:hypothetical protein [Paenibacillus validus]|uniref:hypothetical protein n=1 Tax=Paenibacillus validus TaxID=44253 RepID=UPI003D2C38BA
MEQTKEVLLLQKGHLGSEQLPHVPRASDDAGVRRSDGQQPRQLHRGDDLPRLRLADALDAGELLSVASSSSVTDGKREKISSMM